MERVLSGIKPSSNTLHLGNYFGAIKQHIELQDKYQCFFFVADLHALTTVHNREELERNIQDIVLDYLALGLDPDKVTFFRQSDVVAHPYLAVILSNYTPLGLLKRAHAYKDKVAKGLEQQVNAGLFYYPVLMAADILLYKPHYVPVGEDQLQHLEITRDIAERFNKIYGQTFPLPEALLPGKEGRRLIGTDGKNKMSKSIGNIISIFASEEVIKKQIMGCFTDPQRIHPTDPGRVEGNPVFIYHHLVNQDKDEVRELEERYRQGRVGDVEVKEKLYRAFLNYFHSARARREHLAAKPELVQEILEEGKKKAIRVAEKTLQEVKEKIGLYFER